MKLKQRALLSVLALVPLLVGACSSALAPLAHHPPPRLPPRPMAHGWNADPSESAIHVRLRGRGLLAHDHDLVARAWAGRADHDPDRPEATSVEVDVLTASIHDVSASLSESSRRKVDEGALGESGLDAEKYPHIRLVTTRLEIDGARRGERGLRGALVGHLALHGRTRPVRSPVTIVREGARYLATGTVRLRQSDFGIEPVSKLFGAVAVEDEVVVEYRVACTSSAAAASAPREAELAPRDEATGASAVDGPLDAGTSGGDGG